jgi:hypothetical protein
MHKNYYILKTGCHSFEEFIKKFENIEKINEYSILYCFNGNRNLNTMVIYKLADYSKRSMFYIQI